MAELQAAPVMRIAKKAGLTRFDADAKKQLPEVAEKILLREFKKLAAVLKETKKQTVTKNMLKAFA